MLDSAREMWGTFLHHWLVTAAVADPVDAHAGSSLNPSLKFSVVWGAWIWSLSVQSHCRLRFLWCFCCFFFILEWVSLDCYLYSWIMLHVFCVSDRYLITPHHSTFFSKYTLILTGFDLWDGKIIYSTCSLGFLIPTEAFNKLCYCIELVKSSFFFLSSPGQI